MARSVVVFDLDGTLTDPGVGIRHSVSYAVAALGLAPLTPAQLRAFVGPPLHDSLASLGLCPNDVERAVEHYREYFSDKGLYENVVYDGIEALLTTLRDRGVRLAVATSKPTVFAERVLRHLGLAPFFEQIVGAELDGTRTHKHEVITECLARLNAEAPSEVVMVGDRAHDVAGAARVGLPCIGVVWGYADCGELETAGAACLVADTQQLLARIETRMTLGNRG